LHDISNPLLSRNFWKTYSINLCKHNSKVQNLKMDFMVCKVEFELRIINCKVEFEFFRSQTQSKIQNIDGIYVLDEVDYLVWHSLMYQSKFPQSVKVDIRERKLHSHVDINRNGSRNRVNVAITLLFQSWNWSK